MIGLIQRVTEAQVVIDDAVVGTIGPGMMVRGPMNTNGYDGDDRPKDKTLLTRLLG